jgi:TPR repeat protein
MAHAVVDEIESKKEFITKAFAYKLPYPTKFDCEKLNNEEINEVYELCKNNVVKETNNKKILFAQARYYQYLDKNENEMNRCFEKAASLGCLDSFNSLGAYWINKDPVKGKRFFKIGASLNHSNCYVNLAYYAKSKGKVDKEKMYYEKAIEIDDNIYAIRNLAVIYNNEGNNELFRVFMKRGVKKNDPQSIFAYAMDFYNKRNFEKANKYFEKGGEIGEFNCLNALSHYSYYNKQEIHKAIEYAMKSIYSRMNSDALYLLAIYHKILNEDVKSQAYLIAAKTMMHLNQNIISEKFLREKFGN